MPTRVTETSITSIDHTYVSSESNVSDLIYDNMKAVKNIQDFNFKVLKFNNVLNLAFDCVAQLKIRRVKRSVNPHGLMIKY